MKNRNTLVAISWAKGCSRSDSIAERLGGRSFMVYSPFWGSRYSTILIKYAVQAAKTLWILFRQRPRAVLVMAPPVVACLPVWIYTRLSGGRYAIDAHTAAFVDPRWRYLGFLQRFFSRGAATTIITNKHFAALVESWGAQATIVSDVPVCFPNAAPLATLNGNCHMTFVSSFTPDEPLEIFIEAARRLPEVHFHVTGDYKDANSTLLLNKPNNLEFTGYLPVSHYTGLLLGSTAVICLTTLDHTMQRGAYEAIFLGKPVITSDFGLLREIFTKGVVHVNNTSDDIVRGIRQMLLDIERYKREALELRKDRFDQWSNVSKKLERVLLS